MSALLATASFAAQATTFSFTGNEDGGAAVSGTLTIDTAAIQAANAASAPAVSYYYASGDAASTSALPFLSIVFNSAGTQPTLLSAGATYQTLDGDPNQGFFNLELDYQIENLDGTITSSAFTLTSTDPFATANFGGALLPDFNSAGAFYYTAKSGTGPQETYSSVSTGVLQFAAVAGVPESSTWATMVVGFGLAGATLRRRRSAALAA